MKNKKVDKKLEIAGKIIGKIHCKKHGTTEYILFYVYNNKWKRKVCFKCWVEKTIKGLTLFE